jgi:hypothetical protein
MRFPAISGATRSRWSAWPTCVNLTAGRPRALAPGRLAAAGRSRRLGLTLTRCDDRNAPVQSRPDQGLRTAVGRLTARYPGEAWAWFVGERAPWSMVKQSHHFPSSTPNRRVRRARRHCGSFPTVRRTFAAIHRFSRPSEASSDPPDSLSEEGPRAWAPPPYVHVRAKFARCLDLWHRSVWPRTHARELCITQFV